MRDEQELVRRVLAREAGVDEEFVGRYRGLVLGLARGRFGCDGERAEELLQRTMARLWEHDLRALRAWRGRGKLTTYLTVIVTNLCLKERHSRERHRVGEEELARSRPEAAAAVEPEGPRRVAARERQQAVRRALRRLSARDRLLLALRFGDELGAREVGAVVGLSPAAARKAVFDALRRLRRTLAADRADLFDRAAAADESRPSTTGTTR